jgi:hypothetical protein
LPQAYVYGSKEQKARGLTSKKMNYNFEAIRIDVVHHDYKAFI